MSRSSRFVRVQNRELHSGHKIREWRPPWGKANHSHPTAEYLGRLWALFGPADEELEGFGYCLHDIQTNLVINAYEGPSGSAFGAVQNNAATRASTDALEAWTNATQPVDCHAAFGTDEANIRLGIRGGKPYFEADVDDPYEAEEHEEDSE